MNVIKDLQTRIARRLTETKNPCKTYATEAGAEKAAEKMAAHGAEHFGTSRPANFLIVYVPELGRYTPAFDINELANRPDARGGYVGIFGAAGFYTY